MNQTSENQSVRYEPEENPPHGLSLGLGLQMAGISVAGIIITPVIVIKAAGIEGIYLNWAVFAALVISGITTMVQALKVGRIGAGHVLLMGTSGAFISVCVTALAAGGPGLMAALVLVSALVQFFFAARLSLLRRVITPVVAGTVIMLIPVTVLPIAFGMLTQVGEGVALRDAAICAGVTLVFIAGLALRAHGALRLWVPMIGVLVGCVAAGFFGLFDATPIREAAWIGLPEAAWPGVEFQLGAEFWALLPAFVMVTIVGMIETIGDSIAIQRVSRRNPLGPDYRVVQGAVYADGVGNFLSGVLATIPNTTYSSSVSVTELTGVASRMVGCYLGAAFLVLAFFPKFAALFMAIPGPVAAAFLMLVIGMLLSVGIRVVVRDGLDYRKAVIVGLSLSVGMGFQYGLIYPQLLEGALAHLLQNGMTSGGITAIFLSLLWELLGSRRQRIESELRTETIAEIEASLRNFAAKRNWSEQAANRLCLASEEVMLTLLGKDSAPPEDEARNLRFTLRDVEGDAELEYVATIGNENIENQILLLKDSPQEFREHETSLRLLRHLASSVQHHKYYHTDIISLQVRRG